MVRSRNDTERKQGVSQRTTALMEKSITEALGCGPFRVVAVTIDPSDEDALPSYETVADNIATLDAACDCAENRAEGSDHFLVASFEVRDRFGIRRKRDGSTY